MPIDHAIDRSWVLGLRIRTISPLPAKAIGGANQSPSTIWQVPKAKVSGLGKLPLLWWRTRAETARFGAGLRACCFPRRAFPGRVPGGDGSVFDVLDRTIIDHATRRAGGTDDAV